MFVLSRTSLFVFVFVALAGCQGSSSYQPSSQYLVPSPPAKPIETKEEIIFKAEKAYQSWVQDGGFASRLHLEAVLDMHPEIMELDRLRSSLENREEKIASRKVMKVEFALIPEARQLTTEWINDNRTGKIKERRVIRLERLLIKHPNNVELRKIKRDAELVVGVEAVQRIPASNYDENIDAYDWLLTLDPDNEKYLAKVAYYKKKRVDVQLEAARKIPASDYNANLRAYRWLLVLDPGNEKFQAKIDYYSDKKKEADAMARARRRKAEELALYSKSNEELCFYQSDKTFEILKGRKAFTPTEWRLINRKKFKIGSKATVLACAWGKPDKVNRDVGSWGIRRQWIYGTTYVYTKNGIVTSWSD